MTKTLSIAAIQNKLNALGVPTASFSGNRLAPRSPKAPIWRRGVIRAMLRNEVYIGIWRYGKRRRQGGKYQLVNKEDCLSVEVPAIIDLATWEAAQKQLVGNRPEGGRKPQREYLLSRRLRCGCGYRVVGQRAKRKNKEDLYYTCNGTKTPDLRRCRLPYFRAEKVDAFAWGWVSGFFKDEKILHKAIESYLARQAEAVKPLEAEAALVEQSISTAEKEHAGFLRGLVLLGEDPPELAVASLRADIERCEVQLKGLKEKRREAQAKIAAAKAGEANVQAAVDAIEQIKAELGEINWDEVPFNLRRYLIERLNVWGTLCVEDGEKVFHVSCDLSEKPYTFRLSEQTSNLRVITLLPGRKVILAHGNDLGNLLTFKPT